MLAERTQGYRHHPQLRRFREAADPLAAVGGHLVGVQDEATRRGYTFDATKIIRRGEVPALVINDGQVDLEWRHLLAKLDLHSPEVAARNRAGVDVHPLFRVVAGPVADWESAAGSG